MSPTATRKRRPDIGMVRLGHQTIDLASGLLFGLGVWLLVRRLRGGLVQPLDAVGLVAAAVLLSVMSGALRVGGTDHEARVVSSHPGGPSR